MRNYIDELEREVSHGNSMKAAAEMWMARAQAAERELAMMRIALVHAAGGKIVVGMETMHDLPNLEVKWTERPDICATEFVTCNRNHTEGRTDG